MLKKIDLFTVTVTSITLLLFCLSTFYLLYRYSEIKATEQQYLEQQIQHTAALIAQLDNQIDLDPQLINQQQTNQQQTNQQQTNQQQISQQLINNRELMTRSLYEWQTLKYVLETFIAVLLTIVLFHLVFVRTLVNKITKP